MCVCFGDIDQIYKQTNNYTTITITIVNGNKQMKQTEKKNFFFGSENHRSTIHHQSRIHGHTHTYFFLFIIQNENETKQAIII